MAALGSISARMIVAITLVAAGSCAALAAFGVWQQEATVKVALERELRADYANLLAALDAATRTDLVVSAALPSMQPMKQALQKIAPRGIELITVQMPPAITLARVHAPDAFGDDVSARRKMVVRSLAERKVLGGIETGREVLNVLGTTPILDGDTLLGSMDIGSPFGKTFVETMKARFGVDVAIHQLEGQSDKVLASTLRGGKTDAAVIARGLAGEVVIQRGELDGRPIATSFGPIKSFSGEPIAVFEIVRDATAYRDLSRSSLTWLGLATGCLLLLAGAIAVWLGRGMAKPIRGLETAMRDLSTGKREVRG